MILHIKISVASRRGDEKQLCLSNGMHHISVLLRNYYMDHGRENKVAMSGQYKSMLKQQFGIFGCDNAQHYQRGYDRQTQQHLADRVVLKP